MATTEAKRVWYPDVVTNHADRGKPGYEPICDISKAVRIKFPKDGDGYWLLLVHPATVEAWRAYVQVLESHGETIPSSGGTHNCRNIGSSNWPSLHAYCLACDIPPNTRKTAECQTDILAIKTNSGKTVFKNLASVNDRMHDEIDCSPTDLASGIDWSTVKGSEDDMSKQDALDALNEFFGKSREVPDPQGMTNPDGSPRTRRYVDAVVDSNWHATAGRLGDKNPAKTIDWITRPLGEGSDPQALAAAIVAQLGPGLSAAVAAELKKLTLKAQV